MVELFAFPMPVVAAINGAAAAGGCLMALACDYRVMAEEATIGMTGIRLGFSLPVAALEILREVVPAANLAYVLYSGKLFKSDEALKLGLVNEVIQKEALVKTALKRLQEFTQHAGNPVAALKNALRQNTWRRSSKAQRKCGKSFWRFGSAPSCEKELKKCEMGCWRKNNNDNLLPITCRLTLI